MIGRLQKNKTVSSSMRNAQKLRCELEERPSWKNVLLSETLDKFLSENGTCRVCLKVLLNQC